MADPDATDHEAEKRISSPNVYCGLRCVAYSNEGGDQWLLKPANERETQFEAASTKLRTATKPSTTRRKLPTRNRGPTTAVTSENRRAEARDRNERMVRGQPARKRRTSQQHTSGRDEAEIRPT